MTNDESPDVDEVEVDKARLRVSAQGKDNIRMFMETCNLAKRESCFSGLDDINGFRPKVKMAVERQTALIAKQIAGNKPGNDRYWDAFFKVWLLAASKKLSLAEDEASSLLEPAGQGITAELIELNLRRAAELKLSREEVSRLILFSPLGDIDTYAARANALASHDDLASAQRLELVVDGFPKLEEAVVSLKLGVRDETKRHEALTKRIQELEAGLDAMRATVTASNHSTKVERESLAERVRETKAAVGQVEQQIRGGLSVIERRIEENRQSALHADDELTSMLASDTEAQNTRIETLQAAFDELVSERAKVRDKSVAAKAPPPLIKQRNGVERMFPSVVVKIHRDAGFAAERPLRSPEHVLDRLKRNLEAIGLTTTSATRASAEITAAVLARQWLVIYGQLSHLVVTAMLDGLGSAWNVHAHVPIGQVTPSNVRIGDTEAAQGVRPVLLLHGANRSPLDLYSEELQLSTLRAQMCDTTDKMLDVSPFVIAHLVSSPAGLPIDGQLLSLGPCIDVDAYSWRTTSLGKPEYAKGQLHALDQPATKTAGFALLQQYQLAATQAKELWRCSLRNFINALDVLVAANPRLDKDEFIRQSILACWVAPLVASKTPNIEDRRALFSAWDVQTNEFDADRRLDALLRTDLPGAEI